MSECRNLVIVRAGDTSLHRDWLKSSKKPNWDLIVSWFGTGPYEPVSNEKHVAIKGGKWDGIYKTIERDPGIFDRYDYIWLPDDDIATDADTIDQLFSLMKIYKLRVAQPSLSWDSYFSHFVTLHVPGFLLRYTNFVEIMIPCLDVGILKQSLPLFQTTMSGFGLDWIWPKLDPDPKYKFGIFDCLTVHHTRPIGRYLNAVAIHAGQSPKQELKSILNIYGLSKFPRISAHAYAGHDANGKLSYQNRHTTTWAILSKMRNFKSIDDHIKRKADSPSRHLRKYLKNYLVEILFATHST